jgi:hypothetical protein
MEAAEAAKSGSTTVKLPAPAKPESKAANEAANDADDKPNDKPNEAAGESDTDRPAGGGAVASSGKTTGVWARTKR